MLAGEVEKVAAGAAEFDANLVAAQLALPEAGEVVQIDGLAVHGIHP
jgi:hypothetical protein